MSDLVGQVLADRYRVDAFIGRGGMADVYRVWDLLRAVPLAVKVLRDEMAEDRVFLRRFKREGETLSRLQHPNIVRFYGLEQDDDIAFMLMDFVEGVTLRKEIFRANGPIDLARLIEIMRPLCAALYYSHQVGMVHCDIKPANIMIHQNGTVLLTDFGIARLSEITTSTLAGAGTPAYMAPEQAEGNEPSPETDVYALGVVLFEMLTGGERPHTGEQAETSGSTTARVIWEKIYLPPPSPRQFNPNISIELETLVLTCLARDPDDRYKDTLELRKALEEVILGDEAVTQVDTEIPKIVGGFSDLNSAGVSPEPRETEAEPSRGQALIVTWPVAALTVVLIVLAVIFLPRLFGTSAPTQSPPSQTVEAPLAGSVPTQEGTASTPTESAPTEIPATPTIIPSQSPTTEEVVAVLEPTATATDPLPSPTPAPTSIGGGTGEVVFVSDRTRTIPQIWIVGADGSNLRPLTEIDGGACQPDVSPDGTRIVFISPCRVQAEVYRNASLFILDLLSDEVTALSLPTGGFDPDWSPVDENIIAFSALDTFGIPQVHVIDLTDNSITQLTDLDRNSDPAWSPDGTRLAFVSNQSGSLQIWVMESDGGNQLRLTRINSVDNFSPVWTPAGDGVMFTELSGFSRLVLVPIDGFRVSDGVRVVDTFSPMREVSISNDGLWMVFESWPDGSNHDIYILMIGSDMAPVPLSFDPAFDFDAVWVNGR